MTVVVNWLRWYPRIGRMRQCAWCRFDPGHDALVVLDKTESDDSLEVPVAGHEHL